MKTSSHFFLLLLIFLAACTLVPQPLNINTPSPTHTSTPKPTNTPTETPIPSIRFAVIGDYGTAGEDLAAVANLIDIWGVDLIITTGDNNYPLGEASTIDENIGQYFHEYIYPYQGQFGPGAEVNRFFPSLGNHDWSWVNAQPYLDYFTLPGNERYYDFQWEFIHFFVLDSDWNEPDGIGQSSTQAEWLKSMLAESTAVWKVIYFHHAPYSSGYHGPTAYMQWSFKDWGADVVFSGHEHYYERLMIDEFPYFINGLSGGDRYPFGEKTPDSQVRYREMHGAILVDATPFQITIQFINTAGDVIDTFKLTK